MSYYEPQGWQAPVRQASWEQPPPPSRSGASSTAQREEPTAFLSQFDEVDRAIDNLVKSGKIFNGFPRRESFPFMMGRPYEYDPRMMGTMLPQRHHSVSDYDAMRPHSATSLQGFYAAQRYPVRSNEAEQVMQAKRRMAAQRERELRNYHQEQQYNRSLLAEMSGNKSDRSLSPAAMSEESRRELIARQHRALYGNDNSAFFPNGGMGEDSSRSENQASATPTMATSVAGRGPSPRGVDPFGLGQPQSSADSTAPVTSTAAAGPSPVAQQTKSPTNSTSSPSSNANAAAFGIFEGNPAQQPSHNSASSPAGTGVDSKAPGAPVGPIGSRPAQQSATTQAPNPALNKRSTTPLPSPLSYGFSNDASSSGNENGAPKGAPSTQAPASGNESSPGVGLGWSGGNNVWRSKNSLGVQASVWG
ncbi:hypothetical protein VTO42DRAFT_6845 [Malbranchea cinnamomea]